ncbi:hypothetical protein D3C72_2283160 [compost metagenome]
MPWLDVVAFDDVLEQRNQSLYLRFSVRMPDPTVRGVGKARVDDLDAYGAGIKPSAPIPLTVTGMPGASAFIHQLIDGRGRVAHQVVAADFAVSQ